jgi:hypothetical protein
LKVTGHGNPDNNLESLCIPALICWWEIHIYIKRLLFGKVPYIRDDVTLFVE